MEARKGGKLNRKAEPECKAARLCFPGGESYRAGGSSRDEQGAPRLWRCQCEETQHETLQPYKRSRPPLPLLRPEPGSPDSPSASNADGAETEPSPLKQWRL